MWRNELYEDHWEYTPGKTSSKWRRSWNRNDGNKFKKQREDQHRWDIETEAVGGKDQVGEAGQLIRSLADNEKGFGLYSDWIRGFEAEERVIVLLINMVIFVFYK